jgi:hypothetical protein
MVRLEGDMSLKNPMTPPGIDPGTVRLVAQRLNHYATPDPSLYRNISDKKVEYNVLFILYSTFLSELVLYTY